MASKNRHQMGVLLCGESVENCGMKIITETRLDNLLALIENETRGNVAKFARIHNLSDTQLRTLKSKERTIGEKLARRLEKSIGLAVGALDVPGLKPGADPSKEIAEAINRADFLSSAEKKSFIGMVQAIKERNLKET